MKPDRIWYLVMNTHRARILRGLPERGEPDRPELSVIAAGRHLRAVMGELHSRSVALPGGGRRFATVPGSDPQKEDEREFLGDVAAMLCRSQAEGAFDGLVVFAAPDALGLWRDHAPRILQKMVREEIDRNLVRLSSHKLVEAIRTHSAV